MPCPYGPRLAVLFDTHLMTSYRAWERSGMALKGANMKRPLGLTVLMCIGAGLLALASLAFFCVERDRCNCQTQGANSLEMGTVGARIFLALAVAYATLAILMWRLVYWASLPPSFSSQWACHSPDLGF